MERVVNKGLLVIVSGPSGVGKGTVLRAVFERNRHLKYSISVTTRKPREGEAEGINYFFRTAEDFKRMLAEDAFLEHMEVYGNYYGTPKAYVESLREEGYDVVLEIDVKGAMEVLKKIPDAVSIFLAPPSLEVLRHRLIGRATESEEQLRRRIGAAITELNEMGRYDYVAVNDRVNRCAADILSIIRAEKRKTQRNLNFIKSFNGGN